MNSSGLAVAIWTELVGPGMSEIQSSYASFGGSWSGNVLISFAMQNPISGEISINSTGDAVAVFQNLEIGNNGIQANTFSGGTWGAPVILATGDDNTGNAPDVGIDTSGSAVAIWAVSNAAPIIHEIVQSSTYTGGMWGASTNLSMALDRVNSAKIAVNESGNAIGVWEAGGVGIYATEYNGMTWTAPTLIIAGMGYVNPQVSMNSSGMAIATWVSLTEVQTSIFDGVSWGMVDTIVTGVNPDDPQIAVNVAGNAVLVYEISDGMNTRIQAATYDGMSWSMPVYISEAGQNATSPQVAFNDNGDAIAVWSRSNGSNTIIQASSFQFGGVWETPVDLSPTGTDAGQPDVAFNDAGQAVAIWSIIAGIQASFYGPVSPPPPPSFTESRRAFHRPSNNRNHGQGFTSPR